MEDRVPVPPSLSVLHACVCLREANHVRVLFFQRRMSHRLEKRRRRQELLWGRNGDTGRL